MRLPCPVLTVLEAYIYREFECPDCQHLSHLSALNLLASRPSFYLFLPEPDSYLVSLVVVSLKPSFFTDLRVGVLRGLIKQSSTLPRLVVGLPLLSCPFWPLSWSSAWYCGSTIGLESVMASFLLFCLLCNVHQPR